jgi:sulfur carrier protein
VFDVRRTVHLESGVYSESPMKVVLRNQGREVELRGRRRVRELLAELGVLPETVLVIRGRDLLTVDEVVGEDDVLELRPVISGGLR